MSSPPRLAATPRLADDARFLPGVLLHGRYRIVGVLGRGGMGEVWRADDIKLGQPVALKFLPESLARDAEARERFLAEARIGRQVAHPNVCRLYDLVEFDGHFCVSMEYIDGENLATLLKRIGRLPADKAVDFARDVTAGLAAAHDKGVIHRDLKPANVMIDGRGRARITDFGIAAMAEDASLAGFAGTLVYMAPEQFDGAPASVQSDLYALGSVLYEAFTGKRLFDAASIEQLKALHANSQPPSLSSTVRDIPPTVEDIVRRCLARDPNARPPSELAVLAALPGGDPLQAAVAAGETPTPEMVAAAGKVGDVSAPVAWSLLLAALAGLILIAALAARTSVIGILHPELTPEQQMTKAEQVLDALGYPRPAHRLSFYGFDVADLVDLQKTHNWQTLESRRPGLLRFVYRGSANALAANRMPPIVFLPGDVGHVDAEHPPLDVPGMSRLRLDRVGRLVDFAAVPPDRDEAAATQAMDWSVLLAAAGFAGADLKPATPRWSAPVDSDFKQAWVGTFADQPGMPLHVEAAAYHGKAVWFSVMPPEYRRHASIESEVLVPIILAMLILGFFLILILAAMARRNVRMGRGDRAGAIWLGRIIYGCLLVGFLLRADHVAAAVDEISLLSNIFVQAIAWGMFAWLIYIAFEPYARRRWPQRMISWSRLLAGRWRDPMVGRDVLIGACAGVAMLLVAAFAVEVPPLVGLHAAPPAVQAASPLSANRHLVYLYLQDVYLCSLMGLTVLAFWFMFKRVLRVSWLAHAPTFALVCAAFGGNASFVGEAPWSPQIVLIAAIWYALLLRGGLLPAAVAMYVMDIVSYTPLTLDPHVWYAERTIILFGILVPVLVLAFRTALASKPAFGNLLAENERG